MECLLQKKTLIVLFFLLSIRLQAQNKTEDIAQNIERIAMFVTWTTEEVGNRNSFVITVLGDKKTAQTFDAYFKNRLIKEKKVIVNFIEANEINKSFSAQKRTLLACHILFISKEVENSLQEIISIISCKPILSIGNSIGYAQKGVLVNFYDSEDKFSFEINYTASKKTGLYIDSKLLQNVKNKY